jgi:uncharacterized protein YbbC (DUF1343 family)
MAQTEIFITGREILWEGVSFFRILLAMKKVKFKLKTVFLRRAKYRHLLMLLLISFGSLSAQLKVSDSLKVGAERAGAYLPLLHGKKVALVANHTSVVQGQHLADYLLAQKVSLVKVFAPEHGFRGTASAGELIKDGRDVKTNLPLISLYGKNKKPSASQLADVDIVVFDIQDVGARFYTYISTLSYVMEACAEEGKEIIILDRPNPNGYYIDGPILEPEYKSFVGLHPIPIVHGLTVGEYAKMVSGEGWLKNKVKPKLTVVPVSGYDHQTEYILPIAPSPNLPTDASIVLYPTLCLFEGTTISVGRGTDQPFEIIGSPYLSEYSITFTPVSNAGAKYPKYENELCYGHDLSTFGLFYIKGHGGLYLNWLLQAYELAPDKDTFFTKFFTNLAGTTSLQKQIEQGMSAEEITTSWKADLDKYRLLRRKYLLYAE